MQYGVVAGSQVRIQRRQRRGVRRPAAATRSISGLRSARPGHPHRAADDAHILLGGSHHRLFVAGGRRRTPRWR